ncbi:MAG: response regulator transcription factor [Bacteroidetes bacterium]|nr:response regulator transcription factor [Bacteroidota bacterium]
MISAIAIDDETPSLKIIEHFCAKTGYINPVKSFLKPNEALAWLENNPVDLMFLDIRMPSVSGIDFFKSLPIKPPVIFTTGYSEYAVEGFNLDAVDYLLKPFTYDRFLKATDKVKEYYDYVKAEKPAGQHLIIRADYSLYKVQFADIQYMESAGDYLKFHLNNGKTITARMTMKALMDKLPADKFARVHRSFVVPLSAITSIRDKNVHLGDLAIPIGLNYEEELMKQYGGKS